MSNPKETNDFIEAVTKAWEELAKADTFAEMTLSEFKNKVKPSADYRTEIESLERRLIDARRSRDLADEVSHAECLLVVSSVKSSREHGENSGLYKAMGYVPRDERRSGLVRPSSIEELSIKAA